MASLLAYREEIERHALAGSLRAALVLAKMFDDGIGVDKNLATAYAWLLWAKRHGDRDDDQAARNELYEHTLTVYSELSGDAEDEAYGLVQQLAFRMEQT